MRVNEWARSITKDRQAVVVAVDATQILSDTIDRLNALPPAMIQLGQAMMSAVLVHRLPDHKESEALELQWRVNGHFGSVFAECRQGPVVRGTLLYPRADINDPKANLGEGLLQVRRVEKQASTGIVNASGVIADDVLDYLEKSEQKNCGLRLWVDLEQVPASVSAREFRVRNALGFLVHVLPQNSEAALERCLYQWDQHLQSLGPMREWVLSATPINDVLSFVSGELNPEVNHRGHLEFFCTCTEERAGRALAIVEGVEEQESAPIPEAGDVRCEFCGRTYHIQSRY
jgi:redox-regulated HSP33 family molecular chaperone